MDESNKAKRGETRKFWGAKTGSSVGATGRPCRGNPFQPVDVLQTSQP